MNSANEPKVSSSSDFKVNITAEPPFWPGLPKEYPHGLTGCFYGNLAVCSPNSERMVIPLLGHRRQTLLRDDFRFGTDDPICHPQVYTRGNLYLACIRAPSLQDDINYLHRPFSNSWWIPCPGTSELGRLETVFRIELIRKSKQYVSSLETIKEDIIGGQYRDTKSVDDVFTPFALKFLRSLEHSWRLIALPGTLNDIRLRYVNFLRTELMLRAIIEEPLYFRKDFVVSGGKIHNSQKRYMGAQTANINTALSLYNTGLPVWYICESKNIDPKKFKTFLSEEQVMHMSSVDEIPPIEYQFGEYPRAPHLDFLTGGQPFISRIPTPKAVVLWEGEAGDPARYKAMTAVLGSFRCGWETEQVRATLPSSPLRRVEPEFSLPSAVPVPPSDSARSSTSLAHPPTSSSAAISSTTAESSTSLSGMLHNYSCIDQLANPNA